MSGEASFLASGFSTYSNEVLSRLHDTGKYEIAEHATYGCVNVPEDKSIRWKYYANAVRPDDQRLATYNSNPTNQFGSWRFERVSLDFQQDVCFSVRDPWMMIFENESPLRDYYHLAWMPTVDSSPQKPEWLDQFSQADGVFAYNDWGGKVLQQESGNTINYCGTASPAIDHKQFTLCKDIKKHRSDMGVQEDIFIVGTTMRNQQRKLFPDLLDTFKRFLELCEEEGNSELARKTYMYWHTSYPDIGWNFPQILKMTGLSHKILFTYMCEGCGHVFPSLFQDTKAVCPKCKQATGVFSKVQKGVSRDQLVKIYQLYDVYVQYSVCEGMGMPQIEAAACGVPVMSIDYSAMSDVVRKLNGFPLKPYRLTIKSETQAYQAIPDNECFATTLYNYLSSSASFKDKQRVLTKKGCEASYNWDETAKTWEHYFDSINLKGLQGKWDSPPRIRPILPKPDNLTNLDFIRWICVDFWGRPKKLYSYYIRDVLRNLNNGMVRTGAHVSPYTQQHFYDAIKARLIYGNSCEEARCGISPMIQEDYIDYAALKASLQKDRGQH